MRPPDGEAPRGWQSDAAAFTALVRRWQQPVARVLLRTVGDGECVQDLCQEVFLKVFLAREQYREQGTFSSWLFQIAINVARDAQRRRPQPMHLEDPDLLYSSRIVTDRQDDMDAVARAVADLEPPLREVVALRQDQGMNFE